MSFYTPRMRALVLTAAVSFGGTLIPTVRAQARPEEEPTARERRAAAEAYDRGTSAWLAEDYARAAGLFETAHGLAPTSEALIQAVRAHDRAGHGRRAATLALRLQARYTDDARAQRVAKGVLEQAQEQLTRVDVRCDQCTIEANGKILEHNSFFLEPEREHTVTASFSAGERKRTVRGKAGQRIELTIEPPPESQQDADGTHAPSRDSSEIDGTPGTGSPRDDDAATGGRISPWITSGAIAASLGLGATALWSGLDTLAGVDEYEAMPTRKRLDAGQQKERRTNILIGVAAGAATASVLLSLFTDWDSWMSENETDSPVRASVAAQPGGALGTVEGRFP